MVPMKIAEIHDVIGKMKHGINVDSEHVKHLLSEVLGDLNNAGTWIRREKNEFENYVSVVRIFKDRFGALKVSGFRLEQKNIKR
jgi:hypothetical protein